MIPQPPAGVAKGITPVRIIDLEPVIAVVPLDGAWCQHFPVEDTRFPELGFGTG